MGDNRTKIEEEALTFLKRLISCNTTDYNEKNGQLHVEKMLKELGFSVERVTPDEKKLSGYGCFNTGHTYEDRWCVIGKKSGTGNGRSLILNGHMDTVFPASPDEWQTDPFDPVEKDGKLYGLGSCDMKSGLTALLFAVKMIVEEGRELKGDLYFHSVVDEEAGGGNGSLACIDAGEKADAVLIAEPTMLRPDSAHMGSFAFYLTVEGKSAHGNTKWKGVSAFEKALPIIIKLKELEQKWNKRLFDLLPAPVVTVLQIQAGDGSITLPGTCRMLINFTYHPDGYDYFGEIKSIIDRCAAEDEWFSEHPVSIQMHHDCGPYYTDPSGEWPQMVLGKVRDIVGENIQIEGMPTGADGRLYANVAKTATVIMGPGSMDQGHQPNEFVELSQFYKAIKIYHDIILDWCNS